MPEVSRQTVQDNGVTAFRKQFPIFDQKIYLSSCSQGALSRPVEAAMQEFLESWHSHGNPWEIWVGRMEELRVEFARLINAELAHERGASLLIDAYQCMGTQPIDVKALDLDILVTGALKYLLGSPGVAFMYMRKDMIDRFEPSDSGWFGQENVFAYDVHHLRYAASARRFETGSPPVPNVYASLAALRLLDGVGLDVIKAHVQEIAGRFLEGVLRRAHATHTPA